MRKAELELVRGWRRLIFISHSGQDTAVAQDLARQIEFVGGRTFVDVNDVAAGDVFSEVILRALQNADELVVLWTPWALERPYIAMEVGAAWVRGIRIVQVLHELSAADLNGRPGFPDPLRQLQMIRLTAFDTYLRELEHRIQEDQAR
jgi:hypothetical protein